MEKTKQYPSKKRYDKIYKREKQYCVAFRLSKVNDGKLIEAYKAIPNKMEWFREKLQEYADAK